MRTRFNMNIEIRPAVPDDAPALCAVHIASIRGLDAPFYSPVQIEAWVGKCKVENYREVSRPGERQFVALVDGELAGFSAVKLGELVGCYVGPGWVGRGVGRALCDQAEAWALEEGQASLHCLASLQAKGFYLRRGYRLLRETLFKLSEDVSLEALEMSKVLK
jgi:putative acetyltransferase